MRLRNDRMGVVVFLQSSLLRRFGRCVCSNTLLSSLERRWNQSSAFLKLVNGSETLSFKEENITRVFKADKMLIRWMCNVSLKNGRSSE